MAVAIDPDTRAAVLAGRFKANAAAKKRAATVTVAKAIGVEPPPKPKRRGHKPKHASPYHDYTDDQLKLVMLRIIDDLEVDGVRPSSREIMAQLHFYNYRRVRRLRAELIAEGRWEPDGSNNTGLDLGDHQEIQERIKKVRKEKVDARSRQGWWITVPRMPKVYRSYWRP